jgi:tetratricopeptide (TPR) repeat protein
LEAATYECSALHGIVEGPWKYILAPRPELYDLSKDPGELTNLAGKEPQVAQRLRGRLEAMFRALETAAPQQSQSAVDPEAVKRLQSLGYVGGGATLPASALDTTGEDPKDFFPTYNFLRDAQRRIREEVGRRDEVKKELVEIATRRPRLIMLQEFLAEIAMDERRPADAAGYFAKVVARLSESKDPAKQRPGDVEELAEAHGNLAVALHMEGKVAQAAAHYAEAIRLKPDHLRALNNLAIIRATDENPQLRNGPEAVRLAQRACQLTGHQDANALGTLAAAYAEAGRFSEAVQTARQALDLATQQKTPNLAETIRAGIRLYKAGKPFRESPFSATKT